MLLVKITIILLLMIFSIEGDNNGEYVASGSGSQNDQGDFLCCVVGNQSFNSIDNALKSATNNTIISIKIDVVLSSKVVLENVKNITLIGDNNVTVDCNGIGAVKFVSCSKVTVEGITWKSCGFINMSTHPGIEFYRSSNIVFQHCSIYNSTVQAVVFSDVSGNVSINHCYFVHNVNDQCQDHGSAIYLSRNVSPFQLFLVIDNCNFSSNGATTSVIYIDNSVRNQFDSIYLQNSVFDMNKCTPIYILHQNLHINGSVRFWNNEANDGGGIFSTDSIITFHDKTHVEFTNNLANNRGGAFYLEDSEMYFRQNSSAYFDSNKAAIGGGALFYATNSKFEVSGNSYLIFRNNRAGELGGAIYCNDRVSLLFDENSEIIFNANDAPSGGAVYVHDHGNISFDGDSSVTFANNTAYYGGALYVEANAEISFEANSNLTFIGNQADFFGGVIYSNNNADVSFDGNSSVIFTNNEAMIGGAVYCENFSNMTINGNTRVAFNKNFALNFGGAIHIRDHCNVIFDGHVIMNLTNNIALFGGALDAEYYSNISFDGISIVTFNENNATSFGGAIYITQHCSCYFNGNTTVIFSKNHGGISGGAIGIYEHCNVKHDGNARVTFSGNHAVNSGGALDSEIYSDILFGGNTVVKFHENFVVMNGGGLCSQSNSKILLDGNSTVEFINNIARFGGAIYSEDHSNIFFAGNSAVTLNVNHARDGGAMYSEGQSNILINKHSAVTFKGNVASRSGGAVYKIYSKISFMGNSIVTFNKNMAFSGGALCTEDHSTTLFSINSTVTFTDNNAVFYGGAVICTTSNVLFGGSTVKFNNNHALYGGAVSTENSSSVLFYGDNEVTFEGNNAEKDGGAIYSSTNSTITLEGNTSVTFISNNAEHGGAVYIFQSNMFFQKRTLAVFSYNKAMENGGAIYLTNSFNVTLNNGSNVKFLRNSAGLFGGAIYGEITESNKGKILSGSTSLVSYNNTAFIGPDVYINVHGSCNEICFNNSVIGLKVIHNNPPRKLVLYDPAICVDNQITCERYLLKNVMLGQDLKVGACVLGLFDKPADRTDFLVNSSDESYFIDGARFVSVACEAFEDVSVIGKEISHSSNFSMHITSHATGTEKKFSVELITELSPCHPGFHYDNDTQRCVCYSDNDAVSCAGSTSFIKRGYWFGLVSRKSTVSICPNSYCNFTCCESRNGFYRLSPVRANQCNSHRCGTACGSCTEGYTLSFDSVKCVSVDKCTAGWTALVITLSVIYWIVIVILVFIVTSCHVGIGYLYAITYYYSMLEILLGHNLFLSPGLFTSVSIMSSIVKVTPQFLGQLCLVKNMSGIDQQFIHFVHPLAITVIIAMICLSARISYKFTAFVSRGIVRVICYLLLLSYTSVTTTSLLLLRSITFHNVDKVYTYLSPDMELFHGRHLPYAIVAVLCTIVIVTGLPLLLLIEPFINHKVNFTRIKPLLDQFQGCYKNKYRCFAAYYMICKLVIILIIVVNPPINSLYQFLLIFSSTVLAFIPVMLKPYATKILNIFDGFILWMMILVTMIPLVDDFSEDLSFALVIITLVLPLMMFVAMEMLMNKKNIKKIATYCRPAPEVRNDNNETPLNDIGIIVDDSRRTNATIVDM